MKVVVDYDLCESNAVCMGILPEVFEVRDAVVATVHAGDEHWDSRWRGICWRERSRGRVSGLAARGVARPVPCGRPCGPSKGGDGQG